MTSFAPSNPSTHSPALSPSQGGREVEVTAMIVCRHANATVRGIAYCINRWIVAGVGRD